MHLNTCFWEWVHSFHQTLKGFYGTKKVKNPWCSCLLLRLITLNDIHTRTPLGKTSLEEWSARRRALYLTTHNTHKRQPCLSGIRTRNPSKRAAADPRLRPLGRWDRRLCYLWTYFVFAEKRLNLTENWTGCLRFPQLWCWGLRYTSCYDE